MNREVHVRFWERAEVKFLRATRQNENLPFLSLCQLPPVADVPPHEAMCERCQLLSNADRLVGEQQESFRDGEHEGRAGGFTLDIGNPVALAPAQARFFILALKGCRRGSQQRTLYVLERVDADDGIQAAVDSAGDHRHHATGGAHMKLGSLGAERIF